MPFWESDQRHNGEVFPAHPGVDLVGRVELHGGYSRCDKAMSADGWDLVFHIMRIGFVYWVA